MIYRAATMPDRKITASDAELYSATPHTLAIIEIAITYFTDKSSTPLWAAKMFYGKRFIDFLTLLVLFFIPANISKAISAEFSVHGDELHFSGFVNFDDEKDFLSVLRKNEGVKTVVLNSEGGRVHPSTRIASMIIDFELDTHVEGKCVSSCAHYIHLAGIKRTMGRGSRIGYHQTFWEYENLKETYEETPEEWDNDKLKFAKWIDELAVRQISEDLEYALARGITAEFAIKTVQVGLDNIWYPLRPELMSAGVLTE